jgi:hypothetical protein
MAGSCLREPGISASLLRALPLEAVAHTVVINWARIGYPSETMRGQRWTLRVARCALHGCGEPSMG